MPNLITHYIYSHEAIKATGNKNIIKTVSEYENVFNLGAQGPDIFFYYKIFNFLGAKKIRKVGSRMHKEMTGNYFKSVLQYIKKTTGREYEILCSYLYGIITHYAIDLSTHAYIYYKTGFVRKGESYTYKYSCHHRSFETAIDTILAHEKLGMPPYKIRPYKLISLDKDVRYIIAKMISEAVNRTYGASITVNHAYKAIRSMYRVFRLLSDRSGTKKALLDFLEKLLCQPALLSSAVYPVKLKNDIDFMNKSHSIWFHPCDKSVARRESFYDLLDNAVKESKELCEAVYEYLTDEINLEDTLKRIGSRSYASGIDCNADCEFMYYDCVYER